MVCGISRSFDFPSPDATAAFAVALGALLGPGDTLLLDGPIGAGKTHFARALIQARLATAGLSEDVPSPTFTLIQTYDDGTTEIWHADLYRLTHPDEVEELGLVDAFDHAICLIEWPDRLGRIAPENALTLTFAMQDVPGTRIVTATSNDGTWQNRLDQAEATTHGG